MYFGTTAFKAQNNTVTESVLDFGSVVYNEYLNRKSMLEACTDETQKPLLEAQVECLCEASIKDIIDKIKKLVHDFLDWVKKIVKKVKDFFTGQKYKDAKKEVENLKSELDKANINNINLDEKIKDLEAEIERLKSEQEKSKAEQREKDRRHEEELESKDRSIEFQKKAKENALKDHGKTLKELEESIDKYYKLKETLESDLNPYLFFDSRNYLRNDFSPQRLASCAQDVVKHLNASKEYGRGTAKEDLEKWLDQNENYMYILNDKTKDRLGTKHDLRHGGVAHSSLAALCKEDMEAEAAKYKGKSIDEIYKRIEVSDYAHTDWLAEIMDGYEIFAQNLIKVTEQEFNVTYSQRVGNGGGYDINDSNEDDLEKYNKDSEALKVNELFQRANAAINLCKASVTACGTLINYEGQSIGACRAFMKTIAITVTNY